MSFIIMSNTGLYNRLKIMCVYYQIAACSHMRAWGLPFKGRVQINARFCLQAWAIICREAIILLFEFL